jgi:hypothetical protein
MKLFSKSYDQIISGFSKVERELRALVIQSANDLEKMDTAIQGMRNERAETVIESDRAIKTADKLADLLNKEVTDAS